jgi:hypothetical protein
VKALKTRLLSLFVLIAAETTSLASASGADPSQTAAFHEANSYIYPHLAADGVTSDDVALAEAARACSAAGTRLVLPAGRIHLTGTAQIRLNHCAMIGVGAPAGDSSGSYGTTFLLTSTTVAPFILETGWQISGINFFWPDNVSSGEIRYPPLFNDGGKSRGFKHGIIDSIVIVNAYDGITTAPFGGSGDVKISNSTMWAYHHLFNLTNTGDSWALSNNRFTPGPLLNTCSFESRCVRAINSANLHNALFHITAGSGVTLVVNNTETFSWRYGILIDADAQLGASIFDVAWDGMGTLIDSSSGGRYAYQNNFTGSMSRCGIVAYQNQPAPDSLVTPCFNLGVGSGLFIHDFRTDGSLGSWLLGAGGNTVYMNNVRIDSVGAANDGNDYYVLKLGAPTNQLYVQNSTLSGRQSDSHVHGIDIGTNTVARLVVQDSAFRFLNDSIRGTTNATIQITGNSSILTNDGGVSLDLRGTGKMVSVGNLWDVVPAAVLPPIGPNGSGN